MGEDVESQRPTSAHAEAERITRDIRAPRFSINDDSKPVPLHFYGIIRRRWIVTLASVILAGVGMIFSFINITLERQGVFGEESEAFRSLKFLGVIITLFLIGCVVAYHIFDSQLHLLLHAFLGQRRPPVTWQRLARVGVEILVCCFVPLPLLKVSDRTDAIVDAVVAPLMVLRLYLVPRAIQVFTCGIPNQVRLSNPDKFPLSTHELNGMFRCKILFHRYPFTFFCGLAVVVLLTEAWAVYLADYDASPLVGVYSKMMFKEALYMTVITFTRVGYGDVTPTSAYGKVVSCVIGLTGMLFAAILIWIVALKIRLSDKDLDACKQFPHHRGVKHHQGDLRLELQTIRRTCDAILEALQNDDRRIADTAN